MSKFKIIAEWKIDNEQDPESMYEAGEITVFVARPLKDELVFLVAEKRIKSKEIIITVYSQFFTTPVSAKSNKIMCLLLADRLYENGYTPDDFTVYCILDRMIVHASNSDFTFNYLGMKPEYSESESESYESEKEVENDMIYYE